MTITITAFERSPDGGCDSPATASGTPRNPPDVDESDVPMPAVRWSGVPVSDADGTEVRRQSSLSDSPTEKSVGGLGDVQRECAMPVRAGLLVMASGSLLKQRSEIVPVCRSSRPYGIDRLCRGTPLVPFVVILPSFPGPS